MNPNGVLKLRLKKCNGIIFLPPPFRSLSLNLKSKKPNGKCWRQQSYMTCKQWFVKLLLDGTVGYSVCVFTVYTRTYQTKSGFYSDELAGTRSRAEYTVAFSLNQLHMCVFGCGTHIFLSVTHSHCTRFAFSRSHPTSHASCSFCDLYST